MDYGGYATRADQLRRHGAGGPGVDSRRACIVPLGEEVAGQPKSGAMEGSLWLCGRLGEAGDVREHETVALPGSACTPLAWAWASGHCIAVGSWIRQAAVRGGPEAHRQGGTNPR